jgi:hypothetical protein
MFPEWLRANLSVVIFLGAGGFVIGLLGLLLVKERLLWAIAGSIGLCAAAAAVLALASGQAADVWLPPLLLGSSCFLPFGRDAAQKLFRHFQSSSWLWNPRYYWACLLIAGPLVAFLVADQPRQPTGLTSFQQKCLAALEESRTRRGLTDKNYRVWLSSMPSDLLEGAKLNEGEAAALEGWDLSLHAIRTAGPDPRSNCFGWIFTNGEYWLDSGDIDRILHDNGYMAVESPAPGDLIIYRARDNTILHCGLVRAVESDGLVIIESKLGWIGRFLHAPEFQPNAAYRQYFHTARPDHRIRIADDTSR